MVSFATLFRRTKLTDRSYNEIVENNKRMFLFRDVALELYFSDKRNFLIVFRDKRQRQLFMSRLSSKNDARDAISRSVIGNLVLDTVARAMDRSEQMLEAMTRRWQNREISNVSVRDPYSCDVWLMCIVRVFAITQPACQQNAERYVLLTYSFDLG